MKKVYPFLFLLLFINSITLGQNKFNLNFDDFNPQESKAPTGWGKWGFFKNVVGEKENDGNSVGKVISDKDGRFGCIVYRIPANYDGDTIKLSGRIRFENVKKYVGLLYGIGFVSHQIGSFLGAYLGGVFYELNGNFDYAWYGSIALSIFAGLIHLPIVEKAIERIQPA